MDVPDYQAKASQYLDRGLWFTIFVARIVPGMLIPIYLMLGFTKTNIYKASLITFAITGLYSILALYLLLFMGVQLSDLFETWAGLALIALFVVYLLRFNIWNLIRTQYHLLTAPVARPWPETSHHGIPTFSAPRSLTFFERLPSWIIYAPIILSYFMNAFRFRSFKAPLYANPGLENSGICGESKAKILTAFPSQFSHFIPRFISFHVESSFQIEKLLEELKNHHLFFPLVAKPDIGYMSRGVELIQDHDSLRDYLERFPQGQTLILQEYVSCDAEAGIFYARHPEDTKEPTVRVALTYFPFVTGDGEHSVAELVRRDPRYAHFRDVLSTDSQSQIPQPGEIFRLKMTGSARDGSVHLNLPIGTETPLVKTIDDICRSLPEFWLGRFDVKFQSLDDLLSGKFSILELNGAGGEDLTA